MNLKDKKILITGATGGIGNSLVKKFYELGKIPVKPHKLYKYGWEEMGKLMVKNGHWGPWDSKPPR